MVNEIEQTNRAKVVKEGDWDSLNKLVQAKKRCTYRYKPGGEINTTLSNSVIRTSNLKQILKNDSSSDSEEESLENDKEMLTTSNVSRRQISFPKAKREMS